MFVTGVGILLVIFLALINFGLFGDRPIVERPTLSDTPSGLLLPDLGVNNQRFLADGLSTNTSNSSISLDSIIGGGPPKDGIPSIDKPKFTNIENASTSIGGETFGILIEGETTTRFYPYNILVWHEIVNDEIDGVPLAVTFCPLCGSAIAYERTISGEVLEFGVSGKLFESNLLMYDRKTESLWSQSRGEAVVGDMLGEKLVLYPAQMVQFKEVKEQFPRAEILSDETGHFRDYQTNPYGNYNENEDMYFPVSVNDSRFPLKEIMYIVPFKERSVAFPINQLNELREASIEVEGETLKIRVLSGQYLATQAGSENELPGYFEMWFSWAQHHQEDGIVWNK